MKKAFLVGLIAVAGSAFAQDINFGAQERWLAQGAGYTCGAANTVADAPLEF